MIGDADPCRPICHGVGCPIAASAPPVLADSAATADTTAVKRENSFICLSSSLLF
jgi:hypothetical protein